MWNLTSKDIMFMWKNGSKKSKILNNRFEAQNVIDQLQEQQKKKEKWLDI